ncbi:MAG: hypothetical protein AcusKO_39620 [Acuticoccus sp.]
MVTKRDVWKYWRGVEECIINGKNYNADKVIYVEKMESSWRSDQLSHEVYRYHLECLENVERIENQIELEINTWMYFRDRITESSQNFSRSVINLLNIVPAGALLLAGTQYFEGGLSKNQFLCVEIIFVSSFVTLILSGVMQYFSAKYLDRLSLSITYKFRAGVKYFGMRNSIYDDYEKDSRILHFFTGGFWCIFVFWLSWVSYCLIFVLDRSDFV